MELHERIAAWRKAKGLTRQQFAALVGVTSSAVCYWELGTVQPTHENVTKIVTALKITLPKFYGAVPKAKKAAA